MGLELERGVELFFSKKNLKQTMVHPLPMVSALLLLSKNICNPSICTSNDTKVAQFGSEGGKYLKSFDDKYNVLVQRFFF
jgi:hypothetical protein